MPFLKVIVNLFLLFSISLLINCNPGPKNFPGEKPSQPTGLKVRANNGLTFTLFYYVQNRETSFDGYNIYITSESTGNLNLSGSYQPYTFNGSVPTLIHNSKDVNADQPVSATLASFVVASTNSSGNSSALFLPFQAGKRYFFKITAHTSFDVESLPSNEVSAVALP